MRDGLDADGNAPLLRGRRRRCEARARLVSGQREGLSRNVHPAQRRLNASARQTADVRCGCQQGSRPCVVVLSSERSLVAFVRAVLGEANICVCGIQQWDTIDDQVWDRRPTLFVLDLTVGQQDRCWAGLERLANDPYLRSTPVVVCATVGWLLNDHAEALARTGVYVWREPFDPAEMLTTVA